MRLLSLALLTTLLCAPAGAQQIPKIHDIRDLRALGVDAPAAVAKVAGTATITSMGGQLLVVASPAVHVRIERALNALRVAHGIGVQIEVRLLRMRGPGADRGAVPLSEARVRRLIRRAGKRVLAAPRLTTRPGQRGHVVIARQLAYVKDFDVEVAPDGSRIADPNVATLDLGWTIDVRATPSRDRKTLTLSLAFTHADLAAPVRRVRTAHGVVEVPEVTTVARRLTVRVRDGQTIAVGLQMARGPETARCPVLRRLRRLGCPAATRRSALALIRVRLIDLVEAQTPPKPPAHGALEFPKRMPPTRGPR